MNGQPTKRQIEVLRLMIEGERVGLPCSVRELADRLGIRSTMGVTDHLRSLRKHGWVTHTSMMARSWRVTQAGRKAAGVNSAEWRAVVAGIVAGVRAAQLADPRGLPQWVEKVAWLAINIEAVAERVLNEQRTEADL